jgi:SpoVK/Ycf46/Vps4 family AAA+-type ATPase
LNVEIGGREFTGWTTNHAALDPTVESWATALGLRFLRRFRHFTQLEVQEDVLNRYETTIPFHMKTWIDWEKIEGLDSQTDAKAYIQKHFIDKLNFGALPNKEMRNVSMILFGPPGTSKTTIAKAVAKQLNWPLVTITPSLFLSNGPPGIDSQATRVFSDLRKLQSVVVFFDECDELFRARSAGKEKFSSDLDVVALITGAMLPRLQDLHDRGRLIFILATNRIDAIDNAVRRQGRFDHVVSVGPPDRESRNLLLESRGVPTRIIYTLAPMLDGFTRDEVLEAGSLFAQLGEEVSGGTVDEVLRQRFGENARSIPKDAYEEFKKQREMYCSAWKSAELHRASGQASPTKKRKASSKRSSK